MQYVTCYRRADQEPLRIFSSVHLTVIWQFGSIPHRLLIVHQKQRALLKSSEGIVHPHHQIHKNKLPGYVRHTKTCYLGLFGKQNLIPLFFCSKTHEQYGIA